MPCPGYQHTPEEIDRQKAAWETAKKALLSESAAHWAAWEGQHGIVVLNKAEVPLRTKGKAKGQPALNSTIVFQCQCGQRAEKVLTPKTLSNGHLALCKACSGKIGAKAAGDALKGRTHTEETKAKMRAWWDAKNGKGTARETAMRKVIEDILGGPVLNWDDLTLTTNGGPAEYVGDKRQSILFKCQVCGAPAQQNFRHIGCLSPACGTCERSKNWVGEGTLRSAEERELGEWLRSISPVVESHKGLISPYELDFVFTDRKVAIEYDGLYWHSEAHKDHRYHLTKTVACEAAGVQLIHLFQDEWIHRRDIVKDRLRHLLGVPASRRIHARACIIAEENTKELIAFFNANHLQGWVGTMEAYTARVDGEIVAAMTFSPARMGIGSGGDHWELVRFATKNDTHIPGIASRLLRSFQRKHAEPLVSFADRRWSQGRLYETLGFTLQRTSPPNYWYIKRNHRFHRLSFRKDRLIAEGFDPEKSEHQIMLERGFLRIYDCGSLVYRLEPIK